MVSVFVFLVCESSAHCFVIIFDMNKSSRNPPSRVVVALLRGQCEPPELSGQIWARGCQTMVLRVDYRPSDTLGGEVMGQLWALPWGRIGRLAFVCYMQFDCMCFEVVLFGFDLVGL